MENNDLWSPYDEIFCRSDLTSAEKLTLVTLVISRNKYTSDKEIAEMVNFSVVYAKKILSSLKKKGFITTCFEEHEYTTKRMIHFTDKTKEILYYIDFSKGE